jgi:5-formyltetrahydrofolate cyclo-ligase
MDPPTKSELRAEARKRLRAIGDAERAATAITVAESVWDMPEVSNARVLLLYAALASEVATSAIAAEARARGQVVTYPRCLPETRSMVLHRTMTEAELLAGGSYGISEPDPSCPIVRIDEIDAALVPGLAWDRNGNRLGRGAGYYDRLFGAPGWRAFRCGLFLAAQELNAIPVDQWDVPLDAVLTERELWRA